MMCLPLGMIRLVLYDKSQNEFEAGLDEDDYE